VDRSNGKVNFGYPQVSAVKLEAVSFQPEDCELCKKGIPVVNQDQEK